MQNKNQLAKATLLCFILLLTAFSQNSWSQTSKQVQVTEAGTLRSYFTEEEAGNMKSLILTGEINALDFKVLRDEFSQLETLDLTNVIIRLYAGKAGTYPERKFYVYPKNCIPAYAFTGKKSLKKIILSPSVRNLEEKAFQGCENLKICQILKKTAPNLLPGSLHPDSTAVFIPLGSKDEYRRDERWLPYNIIEGETD